MNGVQLPASTLPIQTRQFIKAPANTLHSLPLKLACWTLPDNKKSMIFIKLVDPTNDTFAQLSELQACQMHRDQYKDHTGTLHPLDYFKSSTYMYHCPDNPTKYCNILYFQCFLHKFFFFQCIFEVS